MTARALVFIALLDIAFPVAAQHAPDVQRLIASVEFKAATTFLESDQPRFARELIALTETPAPPFKEQQRAKAFADMLRQSGLRDVEIDPEGNVTAVRKGNGGGLLVVNAHLDTVFPQGTVVTVKRQGARLSAPGVGDDTRGLALLLELLRALDAAKIRTTADILFVGDVGEEGEGDLRGVRYLLQKGRYKDDIKQVIAIDGGDVATITDAGIGSTRYRFAFRGPGGHSYGAFGLVNPAFAMGNAIAKVSRLQVPAHPKTTFNVGVVSGGTSVNAIPSSVSMDVDIRSESCAELKKTDEAVLTLVRAAIDEENATRSTKEGRLSLDAKVIGERPCGETPRSAPLVQNTAAVVRAFGLTPVFNRSSTDANIPMSMGIPAITIGRGGPGGRQHSPDEWTDIEPKANIRNAQVALAIVLAAAGRS